MSLAPGSGTCDGAVQCMCVYARLLNTFILVYNNKCW